MSIALQRGHHWPSALGAEPSIRGDYKRLAMLRQRFLLGAATAAIVVLSAGSSRAVTINDDFDPAGFTILVGGGGLVDGVDASNLFPAVVSINDGHCTGTLISDQVVVTAAHCFFDKGVLTIKNTTVGFTSATGGAGPATTVTASVVIVNPGYNKKNNKDDDNDIALVILPKKVTTVTPVQRATSIPANLTDVIVTGFGAHGTGSEPPTRDDGPYDNQRRVAQTTFGKLDSLGNSAYPHVSGKQNALFAQFRDPSDPTEFNYFQDPANPTKAEGGVAPADSGSPLFYCPLAACTPGQLLQIGELIGGAALPGEAKDNGYGEINAWTPLPMFAPWIDGNNPDLAVRAQTGSHNWSSPDTWAPATTFATAAGAPGTLPTESSLVWLDQDNTTITLDINATNESLWITGANSSLSIPQAFTLTETDSVLLEDGMLAVNGKLATPMLGIEGGMLSGSGTIDTRTGGGASTGIVANFGGIVAPGSPTSTGTLTIVGDYFQGPGGILLIKIAGNDADKLAVIGNASLDGTVLAMFGTGSNLTRTHTILSATGGLDGTFGNLTAGNLPASFTANLSYTNTDVLLNLTASLGAGGGLSGNQQNVTNALNRFFNNGGALPPAFVTIFGLTGGNLANALSQLSGEAATGAQQGAFQLTNQFLGIMLDPFVEGRGGVGGRPALGFAPEAEALPGNVALAYANALKKSGPNSQPSFEQRWSTWAGGYGGYNETKGDAVAGSHDLTARAFGSAAGVDYHFSPDTVAGFALAGGHTNWGLAQGLGGGRSDAFQAGAYGVTRWGPAYVAAAFGFTNHWMSTDRIAPLGDHLTADFDAQSYGMRAEAGYRFASWMVRVTPYAALQAQSFHTPVYNETDVTGGGYALSYGSRTGTDTRSELGARFDRIAAVTSNSVWILRGRLAWAHDWVSEPSLTPAFQTLPGTSFIVNGAVPAKDSALATAGAELQLASGMSLLAKFDGEFSNHSNTYAGTGTIRCAW